MMCWTVPLALAGAYALAYWAALGVERLVDRPRVVADFPCENWAGHCAVPCGRCGGEAAP